MILGHSTTCPSCAKSLLRRWFDKSTATGVYGLWRCEECGGGFVLPRPNRMVLESYYGDEYRREARSIAPDGWRTVLDNEVAYPNSSIDAQRMTRHCKALAPGTRFLDIGAGFGFFSRAAVEAGFLVIALEPAPYCREVFLRLNGFEAEPLMLDLSFAQAHRGTFDAVLMSQVLEHLPALDETLEAIATLLAPGGIAAIAVPHFRSAVSSLQGRKDMFISPPEHLNFFTSTSLQRLFCRHGFSIVQTETVSRFDPRRIRARFGVAGIVAIPLLRGALRVADAVRLGMYLNAYFRRC